MTNIKRLKYFPLSTLKSYQIISKLRSEFNVLFITSLFSLVNKTSLLTFASDDSTVVAAKGKASKPEGHPSLKRTPSNSGSSK